jgi:hypothetical protein
LRITDICKDAVMADMPVSASKRDVVGRLGLSGRDGENVYRLMLVRTLYNLKIYTYLLAE